MPKLPDQFDLGQRPVPQATQSRADFYTPQVAQALAQAGQTAARIGEEFQQRQDEQAMLDKRSAFVDFESKIRQDALTKKGADAANLPAQVNQSFDDFANQQAGTLKTNPQRRAFQELAVSRKLGLLDWTNNYAAGQKQVYDADTYTANVKSFQQDAVNNAGNPNAVDTNLKLIADTTARYLKTQGASPEQIQQVTQEEHGNAVSGVAQALLADGNYKQASGYIDKYRDVLPPQRLYALNGEVDRQEAPEVAQSLLAKHGGDVRAAVKEAALLPRPSLRNPVSGEIHRLGAESAAAHMQYRLDVQDRLQAAQQSYLQFGTFNGPAPSKAELVSAFGANRGEGEYESLQTLQKVGTDIQAARGMTDEQQNKLLESYAPKPNSNIIEANENYKYLYSAIEQIQKQRKNDPASYALSLNQDANAAYENFTKALSDSTLNQAQKSEAAQAYAAKADAAQRSIGIAKPSIVPKGYAQWLSGQFDPQKGENTAQVLQSQSDLWGKYWPQVYGQVQEDIPAVAKVIGSGMPAPAASYLAELSKMKPKELDAALPADKVKGLDQTVQQSLGNFFSTTKWNVGGGAATDQTITGATATLARGYMLRGDSQSDAVTKAANDVILGRYSFRNSMRIPAQYDPGVVEQNASAYLDSLTGKDIKLPPGNSESFLRSYKRNSVWVTNGDESGLVLVNPDTKAAVLDHAGQPIDRTWDQLLQGQVPKPVDYAHRLTEARLAGP